VSNTRLSAPLSARSLLQNVFQLRIFYFVNEKSIIRRLNDVQNAASHRAVIRVYDDADNVIETHEHKGEFKEPCRH
jgi:hypothetical protein